MSEKVIYLLVRVDLKMGVGKMVAQAGHAVQELINKCQQKTLRKTICPKISLKINLQTMKDVEQLCIEKCVPYHIVIDAGRTQIPENTPTVLGIGPISKGLVNSIVSDLKLL